MAELATKWRAKYPGAYDDLSDDALEQKVLAKYPEYADLAAPKRTAVDTAVDVAKGIAKGAGNTVTSPSILAPLIEKMTSIAFKRPVIENDAACKFVEDNLTATNTPQMVGKGIEMGAEIAGPSAFSRISRFVTGRRAASTAAQLAKDAAEKVGQETLLGAPKPLTAIEKAAQESKAGDTLLGRDAFEGTQTPLPNQVSRGQPVPGVPLKPVKVLPASLGIKTAEQAAEHPSIPIAAAEEGFKPQATKLPYDGPRPMPEHVGLNAPKAEPAHEVIKVADELANAGKPHDAIATIEKAVPLKVEELVAQMRAKYGSKTAGEMLYGNTAKGANPINRFERAAAIKRLAPTAADEEKTAGKLSSAAVDRIKATFAKVTSEGGVPDEKLAGLMERIKSEGGYSTSRATLALGGGAAGAAIGGTQGDTTEEHIKNAAIGGAAGAVAVPLLAHAFAQATPQKLQGYVYNSILSSPQSIIKAYLGGAGGAVSAAAERMAAGDVVAGKTILAKLFSPSHITDMVDAFRNPGTSQFGAMAKTGEAQSVGAAAPGLINRAFDAVNEPAVKAMLAGGVSKEDAIRYTLSGLPTTEIGKDILGLWSRYFSLRLATSMFPRVGVQVLERGLERSPVGLMGIKGLNEGVNTATKVARASIGTAGGAAAYAGSDKVPDWAKPYLTAASAVYALPVASGMAAGAVADKGKGILASAKAGMGELAKNMPFPQYGPAETPLTNPEAAAAMVVPNVLRDVARAADPHERDTSKNTFGRTMSKIPGLREKLPVKGDPTNVAGVPNNPPSTAVGRFFSPSATTAQPFKDVPPAVTSEIRRLGVELNPPSFGEAKKLTIGGKNYDVPPDLAQRSLEEKRKALVPALEKLVSAPAYQRADDTSKKARIKAVISQVETASGQKAKANVIRVMRESGAFRGTR